MTSTMSTTTIQTAPARPSKIPIGEMQKRYAKTLDLKHPLYPLTFNGGIPNVDTTTSVDQLNHIRLLCGTLSSANLATAIKDFKVFFSTKGNIQSHRDIEEAAKIIFEQCILASVVTKENGFTNIENGINLMMSVASFCVPMPDGSRSPVLGIYFIQILRNYLMTKLSYQSLEEISKVDMNQDSESEKYYQLLEHVANAVHAAYYLYTLRDKSVPLSLSTKHFGVVMELVFKTMAEAVSKKTTYDAEMRKCRAETPAGYREEYHREGLAVFDLQIEFCGLLMNDFFARSRDHLTKDKTPLTSVPTIGIYYERYEAALTNPASPMFTSNSREHGCRLLDLEVCDSDEDYSDTDEE